MTFYSARLLFVILIDDGKPRKRHDWDEIVVVFRARDFGQAFERALEIGRSQETEYLNYQQHKVRWAFAEVATLDIVGKRVDGVEVASRLFSHQSKEPIPFNTQFHPENSRPSQSF